MIGGLDRPTRGRVWVDGAEVFGDGEDELVRLRREKIGFVFQAFGLVPILTAAENIEVPLRLRNEHPGARTKRVGELARARRPRGPRPPPALRALGRRAAARGHRARARQPAQAPDRRRADGPARLLERADDHGGHPRARRSEGVSAIVATHDPLLLDVADRVVELRDGEAV